jgi:signal transduction histidine kinase
VWTEDKVRRDGVFLAYELLEQTPEQGRVSRLRSIQDHFSVDLALISLDELERRIGRRGAPGEEIPHRMSLRHSWYFIVFDDGSGVLAAGPVNPARPRGVVPIGLLLIVVLLPVIAVVVALRLGRGILRVEQANQAFAVGNLSVRVDDDLGPSSELAASFNAMAERVEVLVRSRDELVQAVSHELGSPLARLRFHAELLENVSATKRSERIQAMARELDALEELVAELLSSVQSDDLELDYQSFDPKQAFADLAELVRHEAPDHRMVDVNLKLMPDMRVYADQRLFLRAAENLLRNAVRYANSEVLLELSKEGEEICLAVHDDGPGIPEALREKVVAPFYRVQSDRGRKTGGVGLGLAIVDRITKRHHGHLVITSSSLGGARVATVWPDSKP